METALYEIVTRIPKTNPHPKKALHVAASKGFVHVADYLLRVCQVNVNECWIRDITALHLACSEQQLRMVKLLLLHPAIDINPKYDEGGTPVHTALMLKNVPMIRMFISHPNIDPTTIYSLYAMKHAMVASNDILEELLINYDTKFVQSGLLTENTLRSLILCACTYSNVESARLLVDYSKFNVNNVGKNGETILGIACASGELGIVKMLLSHPKVNLDQMTQYGTYHMSLQAVRLGSIYGHAELVKFLLQNPKITPHLTIENVDSLVYCTKMAMEKNYALIAESLLDVTTKIIQYGVFANTESVLNQGLPEEDKLNCLQIMMYMALRSCSGRSIPKIVEKCWNKTSNVHPVHIKACYMVVYMCELRANQILGHCNETRILYHAMRFGLFSHVKKLLHTVLQPCKAITQTIPGKRISIIQLSLQNIKLTNYLQEFLNTNSYEFDKEELIPYRDWYATLGKLSTSVKDAPDHNLSLAEVNTVIDWIDRSINDQHLCSEYSLVGQTVDKFMNVLSKKLAMECPLLAYKPVLVGSASENTRPFLPNEFDYLLVLELAQYCEFELQAHVYFRPKLKKKCFLGTEIINKITQSGYLIISALLDIFKKAFINALFSLINFASDEGIILEPNSYECGTFKSIHCLHLIWRGHEYKDMNISIDLVPAFELPAYKLLAHKQLGIFRNCPFYVFTKPRGTLNASGETLDLFTLPVAFSIVERRIIRSIPEDLRNGFVLAKALRRSSLLPRDLADKLRDTVSDIEDYLPTYMLKTCVFFIAFSYGFFESKEITFPKWPPYIWALLIYKKLLEFLKAGKVPNFFETNLDKSTGFYMTSRESIFECNDPKRLRNKDKKSCCIRRDNLVLLTEHMLNVIRKKLFYRSRDRVIHLLCEI